VQSDCLEPLRVRLRGNYRRRLWNNIKLDLKYNRILDCGLILFSSGFETSERQL
jgi:hypothetical protein